MPSMFSPQGFTLTSSTWNDLLSARYMLGLLPHFFQILAQMSPYQRSHTSPHKTATPDHEWGFEEKTAVYLPGGKKVEEVPRRMISAEGSVYALVGYRYV